MKFKVSGLLTLDDIKTDEYKWACEFAKNLTEKNWEDNICAPGELLKIEDVEIVRNRGQVVPWITEVVPWITAWTYERGIVRKISFNAYDSSDNFTIVYKEQ